MSSVTAGTGLGTTTGTRLTRATQRRVTDLVVVGALLLVGVQAFGPVFGGFRGYLAAGGGAALGMGLAWVSWSRHWTKLGTLSAGIAIYLIVGGPIVLPSTTIAGVIPTLETLQRLVLLTWQAWRDLLTVSLPAGLFDGPAVVPLVTALVTSTFAASFVLRLRRPQWALLPTLVLLIVGILWGAHEAPLASLQGLAFAAIGLAWTAWRSQVRPDTDQVRFVGARDVRASRTHQTLLAAGSIVAACALAAGATLALGAEPHRHVLRDDVTPPLDLRDFASPLTLYRSLELSTKPLLTVTGLPAGARLRLAAMDAYDGDVYNVSDSSARFARVGRVIEPTRFSDAGATVHRVSVVDNGYTGHWVPGGGDLRGVEFSGPEAKTEGAGLFFNPATGTALSTVSLTPGSRWTVDVTEPTTYGTDAKAELSGTAKLGTIDLGPTPPVSQEITAAVPALVGDATTPMNQLRAMETSFRSKGYYSNGSVYPSLAGHSLGRLGLVLGPSGQMVGDDEQYAVTMALMARSLGMPARVVMGLYPKAGTDTSGRLALTGTDVHAWVEVLFQKYGWVSFDPTPDTDRKPPDQQPQPQTRNDPQVLPPPEVPDPRKLQAPPQADSDQTKRKPKPKPHHSGTSKVLAYVAVGAAGGGLLLAPFAAVIGLKALRRRRRRGVARPADQVSGGWAEIADVATDLRTPLPRHATRLEGVGVLRETHPEVDVESLARRTDAHVWGPADPTPVEVDEVWAQVSATRLALLRSVGPWRRLRARVSLRSLLKPTRLRHEPRRRLSVALLRRRAA